MKTNDILGSPHDWTRVLGKFSLPVFSTEFSLQVNEQDPSQVSEGTANGTSIDRVDTVYEYPWEQVQDQIHDWVNKGILDIDNCNYTVIFGNNKYTINSFEEFMSLDMESLVLVNKIAIDSTGLGLSAKDIVNMARSKALEKVNKNIGEQTKHSVINMRGE